MNNKRIAVIGLGYVGLPVAVLFASKYKVIGYDINSKRIDALNNYPNEIGAIIQNNPCLIQNNPVNPQNNPLIIQNNPLLNSKKLFWH